ncbi:stage III sporulation protein SpoAB [Clostridia bacterium]|nr:stage III sporulation protein SpoAB [Clostridia bacterium]
MLRIIGALLVAGGMASAGIMAVWRMGERVRALSGMVAALDIIQTEISFRLTSIPDIIDMLAAGFPPPISSLFTDCQKNIGRLGELPFSAIWAKSVKSFSEGTFKPRERETLLELGNVLGRYDSDGQTQAISYARRRFEGFLQNAEEEKSRQGKVYGALGIASGAAAMIVLI